MAGKQAVGGSGGFTFLLAPYTRRSSFRKRSSWPDLELFSSDVGVGSPPPLERSTFPLMTDGLTDES